MKRNNGLRIATVAVGGAACIFVLSAGINFAKGQKNNIRQIETPVAGMSVVLGDFIENSGQTEVSKLLEINGVKKDEPKMDTPMSAGDDKEQETTTMPEEPTTPAEPDNIGEIAGTTPEETTEPENTTESQEESPYSGIAVAICDSYVNVRSGPGTEYKILGKIYKNCAAEILEETDGWYKMTSGNLTGYIKAEYFATGDEAGRLAEELGRKVGKVTASALRLRKEPSLDAKIVTMIPNGEKVAVVYEDDEWVKVQADGTEGWVFKEYLDIEINFDKAITLEEERAKKAASEEAERIKQNAIKSAEEDELRQAIVNYALQFVGNKYVYGGNSLTEGTDCSGFVKLIYKEFGYGMQRRASLQYRDGVKINWEDAKPGDLIFYGDESVDHVVMYIGNQKVVHASNPTTGIIVSTINYKRVFGAIRVIQ